MAFMARWALALMLLAWFVFAFAWGALHLVIVPRIGELRPQLELLATRATGISVRVESITAYSTNLLPAFELVNVRLLDAQGREALRLPRILVSLSPRSLLNLKFDQILLDSPVLNVRRAPDGRIWVAGLDLLGGRTLAPEVALLDRLFSQPEFIIRNGAIVWTDEKRAVAPLALRDVDFVLRNRARMHEMRVDATPPSQWGDRFRVMAQFEQPFLSPGNGRWKEWTGQAYVDLSRIDVALVKQYADPGVDIDAGAGAVRAWVDIARGAVVGATADVALSRVAVRLGPDLQPLQLATLSGRLSGQFAPDVFELATRELAFDTQDGIRWPGGNLRLKQQQASAAKPQTGELQADRLDLAALAQIAERLPLDTGLRHALALHRPAGLVDTVQVRWQQPVGQPSTYQAEGRVQELVVRAVPDTSGAPPGAMQSIGIPGIQGATVDFSLNESGGKASLTMNNGSIDLPGVFGEPVVPFQRLAGDLSWQVRNETVRVQVSRLRFGNADAQGEMDLKWQTSDPTRSASKSRFPGILDMQGTLSRADGARVHRYLPLVLDPDVRLYVRDAVQAGAMSSVRFKVKGDLWDVPFPDRRQGEFLVAAQFNGATLAYVPRTLQLPDARPWPALTRLAGELVIDRQSMRVKGARAGVAGATALQITKGDATIADLASSIVVVNLDARGPLSELLAFANNSPVSTLTDQALSTAAATGPMELRLKLEVPVIDPDRTRVQGSLMLQGNDIQLSPGLPRLVRSRGAVAFTDTGFSLDAVQARLLGGDVRIDGGTVPPAGASAVAGRAGPDMAFKLQGVVTAEALRQMRDLAPVSRLAQHLAGSAPYSIAIGVRGGLPEVTATSTLVGMALNLPQPLGKSADVAMPLRIEYAPVRDPAASPLARQHDQLVLGLGRVASVHYLRELSAVGPRVVRGFIGVGTAGVDGASLPPDGVLANLEFDAIDVDVWDKLLSQVAGPDLAPLRPDAGGPASNYWPTSVALRARTFTAAGRTLHDLVAGGVRDGALWRANVDAQELDGYLEYREPSGQGAGRLFARLSRLTLGPSSASAVESLLGEQPQSIPALDIVVEHLDLRGKKLGRVEVDAVNRAVTGRGAGAREWRLNRFDVISPEATFRATGNWAALNAQQANGEETSRDTRGPVQRRTVMNFRLDIQNAGDLLGRVGTKDVVRRGKGAMQGQVAWAGSPLSLDYATLTGSFNVNVENGQFLKAEPGLAKLLGVLSLQSLPRRLTLDFRDVFSEGFVFDVFRGDVRIEQGVAYSDNLQMKGVNAAVLMDGHADLFRETQDIRVVVVPEINAGTASLIAAAINPAIGLGSFLAQFVLRKPLMEAATQEFHIDGSWTEPRIQRVDRNAAKGGRKDSVPGSAGNR
jgi:uncharacterized protein (TIGR02099 family)